MAAIIQMETEVGTVPGNPLFQMLTGGMNYSTPAPSPAPLPVPQFANPMQKMNFIMQAMTNPAAFVKQQFPDIPNDIQNNSNQVLEYLKQTRGISDQQIQNALSMAQQFMHK